MVLIDVGPDGPLEGMELLTDMTVATGRSSYCRVSRAILAACLIASFFLASMPMDGPAVVAGGPATQALFWNDQHRFVGNCTQYPEHDYFFVNASALWVDVLMNFTTNGTFPGANLVMYGPDGFVLFAEPINYMGYHTNLTDMTKRGRWRMALSINSCSFEHPVKYVVNIEVANRLLAAPTTDVAKVTAGETVRINGNALGLTLGERCRFDLGDGSISLWSTNASITTTYSKAGTYKVRAMVNTSGGRATDWSEPLTVKVDEKAVPLPKADPIAVMAGAIALVLGTVGLMGLLMREALRR
jgi:hypothetical protein